MTALAQLEMTFEEARETDRLIKRHINTTRYLLLDMRDRKGWKALGYESFVEYGEKELGFQKTHIYELTEAAEIGLQIGFSEISEKQPKESHIKPLKAVPESVRKEIWEEATRKAEAESAKLTAKRVEEAVQEWKRRSEEFRQESNARRRENRELKQQIELLESRQPEVVPVIPSEFATLEDAIAAKKKELDRLNRDTEAALGRNSVAYESRERLRREVEDLTATLSRHVAGAREQARHKDIADTLIHATATAVADMRTLEHAPEGPQAQRWERAEQQLLALASEIRALRLAKGAELALAGELLQEAA